MIPPGQIAQLIAEAVDPGGTRVEDRSITWESSDEQIVEVSPTGVVTGIAYGAADVFATTDGVVGSRLIAVSDPVPIEACKIKNTMARCRFRNAGRSAPILGKSGAITTSSWWPAVPHTPLTCA